MKKRTPIANIMSKEVTTVNHTNSLNDVQELFREKQIHHLPVVSGDKLIGMVSKSDLERISFVSNYNSDNVATEIFNALTIEQVMTKHLTTVEKGDTVLSAAKILAENEFHALPVVEGNKLVGIITTKDLLTYLIKQH